MTTTSQQLSPTSEAWDATPQEFIKRRLESGHWARDIRRKYEQQWLLNLAFFYGIQHARWSRVFATLDTGKLMQSGKVKYTGNQILPLVLRRMAQLVSAPPGWNVQAKSTSMTDTFGAKVAEDTLNHIYQEYELHSSFTQIAFWMVVCGSAFARVNWTPTGGPLTTFFLNPVDGEPIPPEFLSPEMRDQLNDTNQVIRIPSGDLTVEPLSPFHVYVPPYEDRRRRPWIGQVSVKHIDEIYDNFGKRDGDRVYGNWKSENRALWAEILTKVQGLVGPFGGLNFGFDDEEAVLIREIWHRACARYPNGRYVIEANGIIMRDSPNPYLDIGVDLPLIQFDYIQVGNRPWGKGMVEDLIWPQKVYNQCGSNRVENMNLMSRPKWLIPRQCNVDGITNTPGGQIEYDGDRGQKPEPVKPEVADRATEILTDRVIRDLQDISSQQDVTQAKTPPNVRSGVAIRFLQERDEHVLAPIVYRLERSLSNVGAHILKIVAKYWPHDRILKNWGEDRVLDIQPFREAALDDRLVVTIPAGSMVPRSKAAQAQLALELAQGGILDIMDPQVRKSILEVMELGTFDRLFAEQMADVRRGELENRIFSELGPQGGQGYPGVEPFDDHQAHLRVHNILRKSDVYELMEPIPKQALDAHCEIHEAAVAEMAQQAMALAEAQKGTPGAKGTPSPPAGPQG